MSDPVTEWDLMGIGDFDRHAREWDALNQRTANSLLLTADFYAHLLSAFGDGRETLAIGRVAGEVIAAGILVRAGMGSWQTFQPSQAPLGAWLLDEAAVGFDAALGSLQRCLPGPCLVVGVTQIDPDHIARPADAGHIRTLDYIRTARITVPESYAAYWAERGRNLRQNLKRQRNRLAKESVTTRLELIEDPESMARCVQEYGDLESAGWKAESGTAVNIDNDQGRFYSGMLRDYAADGRAFVARYFYNETLVATDLCVCDDNELVILKTTHDESQARSSPAFLMRQEVFERYFDAGRTRRVEFYGKLMDWHTKWSKEVRRMYHVNRYRWSFLARFLAK